MRVIFLGPPGAGKGTQAQLINRQTNTPILVMGDMLRDATKRGDAVGKEAEKYMKDGKLVPDELVIKIILARMDGEDCQKQGFMLDGFPRTSEQAEALDKHLAVKKAKLDVVLYFSVPDEIVKKRIPGRMICTKCNAIFHEDEQTSLKCSNCKGEFLTKRNDDKPEVIEKRLEEYKKKTLPLLDYYKSKKILIEIPANRKIEEVFADCMKKLNPFLNKPKK